MKAIFGVKNKILLVLLAGLFLSGCGGEAGLVAHKYQGQWSELPNFAALMPIDQQVVADVGTHDLGTTQYGLVLKGNIKIETAGQYKFYLRSDDGSTLSIDGNVVIQNDGVHTVRTASSDNLLLSEGNHDIKIEYFQLDADQTLELSYQLNGGAVTVVPSSLLSHLPSDKLPDVADGDDNSGDDDGGDNSGNDSASGLDKISIGEVLNTDEYLVSSNGDYRLTLQGDGNLVLRDWQTRDALWSSKSNGDSAVELILQNDGNLVLYTAGNSPVWASNTVGSGANELILNDDGSLVLYQGGSSVWGVNQDTGGGGDTGGTGSITHVGTTEVYDSNGQNMDIARPSGSQSGDLLVLVLHRTDDDLPLFVDGWTRAAECYKRDNGYNCVTYEDCESWHNGDFCAYFGDYGRSGHDLAQSIFYKRAGANEPSSYSFDLNVDSNGHPGWAILTALRGANTSDPIRDWANEGCDGNSDSLFPSVYGVSGDMVLLSQSFDDAVAKSKFGAPSGTTNFGYVSKSDEAGFLFGGVLTSTGETGKMKTSGDGASSCKDALVSLTIKPE